MIASGPLLAGCDLGTIPIAAKPAQLVVHGILNPQVKYQTVLVERTLTGAGPAPQGLYVVDPNEAILTDGGIPEDSAAVDMALPDGRTVRARELSSCYRVPAPPNCPATFPVSVNGGNGAGMYVFDIDGATLVPGGLYKLRIVTRAGELVTGEATFPSSTPSTAKPVLDYSRDTLARISWPATPPAPAYQVRIESPYGVWSAVTDSTGAALNGLLRFVNLDNLPHVFIPGYSQQVTVSAVDANVYDYYRTSVNSATGTGILSRLKGAFGVFGAIVTVDRRTLNVTARATQSFEATYYADTTEIGYLYGPYSLRLYVESAATSSGQASLISVRVQSTPKSAAFNFGALGTLTGTKLALDLSDPLKAEIRGDTIIGHYSKGATARFIKR